MLIENTSKYLLKKTRAKAKMYEYNIPLEDHIEVEDEVSELLLIAIGAIGNITAEIVRSNSINVLNTPNVMRELEFSSKYFDSFLNSRIDSGSSSYYLLFGSVAYYLCNYIGSSKVLANKIELENLDLNVNQLDIILTNIMLDNAPFEGDFNNSKYLEEINEIKSFLNEDDNYNSWNHLDTLTEMRNRVYYDGTDLELLMIDCIIGVLIIKTEYSAINLLPKYSKLKSQLWEKALVKNNLIQELWPAQRKLGEAGIFCGTSSVVQMPTGTGKTKSFSLIIYSTYLSANSNLCVIVAPFRSLCREISRDLSKDLEFEENIKVNGLTDILKIDEKNLFEKIDESFTCLIVTPEKLLFLMRQNNELFNRIGLVIFDEGHLFDDPYRGASYELLVSSIIKDIPPEAQKILVSAVIPNSMEINEWMNGGHGSVVSDNTIKSTEKLIAVSAWKDFKSERFGYLYFLDPKNFDKEEFYVPRLVKSKEISKLGNERKKRYFPHLNSNGKVEHNDISIYYALHLCVNGGVAIFCGRKDSANKILERIMDLEARGYDISPLLNVCDKNEVSRITRLISKSYGEDNIYYKASIRGAFVHHSDISSGLRISIEGAMEDRNIGFIACTSTLAQGVNLPIKYLIISSIYQGKVPIRTRDFHNLIGRAGRSGIYTEGSIIFSKMNVYKNKGWRWERYKDLMNADKSESCLSAILMIVDDFESGGDSYSSKEVVEVYYKNRSNFVEVYENLEDYDLKNNVDTIILTLKTIESFLMSYLMEDNYDFYDDVISNIIESTFAYHIATDKQKEDLVDILKLICKYILDNVDEKNNRIVYSRSLLGVDENNIIKSWLIENQKTLEIKNKPEEILVVIFPLLIDLLNDKELNKLSDKEDFLTILLDWINGYTYKKILSRALENNITYSSHGKTRLVDIGYIIKLCDKTINYSTTLFITAILEIYSSIIAESENETSKLLSILSSQVKYGLNDNTSINIYELGFQDRFISQRISDIIDTPKILSSKLVTKKRILSKKDEVKDFLDSYPSVFTKRLNRIR